MRRLWRNVIAIAFVACGGGGKLSAPSGDEEPGVVADTPPAVTAAPAAADKPVAEQPPSSPEAEANASKAFLKLVEDARYGIRDCHAKAIKADAKLASVRVMLLITTSFTRKGAYLNSATSPPLGDAFEACMKTVMAAWTLGPQSVDYSFQRTVILDP